MQKLYCYIDENGLETTGRIFVVAAIMLEGDPLPVSELCEELERLSGKMKTKWGRAEQGKRLDYLRRVFRTPTLRGRLCYAVFRETRQYEASTIEAIARAVRHFAAEEYRVIVYIDALAKTKRQVYGAQLRQSGIRVHKTQGVAKDENNPLVRLSDAIAGFVRDALDNESKETVNLFRQATNSKILIEI